MNERSANDRAACRRPRRRRLAGVAMAVALATGAAACGGGDEAGVDAGGDGGSEAGGGLGGALGGVELADDASTTSTAATDSSDSTASTDTTAGPGGTSPTTGRTVPTAPPTIITSPPPTTPQVNVVDAGLLSDDQRAVLNLVASNGGPGTIEASLQNSAQAHSGVMASSGSSGPAADGLSETGFAWRRFRELTGQGATIDAVLTYFQGLAPNFQGGYTHIGVGVSYGNGQVWVDIRFGSLT